MRGLERGLRGQGRAQRRGEQRRAPTVTSMVRGLRFWLGLLVPERGGGNPKYLAKGSESLAQQGRESCQKS